MKYVLLVASLISICSAFADEIPPYSREAFQYSLKFMGHPGKTGFYSGKKCITEWDHIVSLKDAWESGAWAWTNEERTDFAQNAFNLKPACFQINRSKGESTPRDLIRKSKDGKGVDFEFAKGQLCDYLSFYSLVKMTHNLSFDNNDKKLFKDQCEGKNICTIDKKSLKKYLAK